MHILVLIWWTSGVICTSIKRLQNHTKTSYKQLDFGHQWQADDLYTRGWQFYSSLVNLFTIERRMLIKTIFSPDFMFFLLWLSFDASEYCLVLKTVWYQDPDMTSLKWNFTPKPLMDFSVIRICRTKWIMFHLGSIA